jgi:hypothetical protein
MVSEDIHQVSLPLETEHAVRLMDPEKGTPLVVFPIAEAGRGFHTVVRRPDFVLHQTIQGAVVELGSSDVTVTLPQGGIPHITRRGGVRQSPKTD